MNFAATVAVSASTVWVTPDAPRPVDRPVLADEPDHRGWVAALDLASRLGLHGRVATELLLGEPVVVLDERGPWSEVVAPWQPSRTDQRGYRGWVRSAHLWPGRPEAPSSAETAVVVTPTAVLHGQGGGYVVSWATRLPVRHRSADAIVVDVPGGGDGRLEPTDAVVESPAADANGTTAAVVHAARRLLGLRYLWGGLTGWGLDCSGLVHGAYRTLGVTLPRDAEDQQHAVDAVTLDEVRVGDLYFFAGGGGGGITHVGFATSAASAPVRTMLHAPEDSARIVDEPLSPEREAALAGAGRVAMRPTDVTRPGWS